VKEAAERLNVDGLPVCVLHFGQVYPLTPSMIAPYRLETKNRICVENNATGQFAGLLKRELGIAVDQNVLKYDGDCFTVEELYQTLKSLLA
jgi:2-oxoglutarate ferredoxin oxidoreductase subunit alpha